MRFENNNKEVIKRITNRSLKTNKVRNIFAIIAIILTSFMISSVFSIGISFIENYKTMNLRLQGTTANVVLSNPIESQIEKIKSLDLSKDIGYEINVGSVFLNTLNENRRKILIKYLSKENYEEQVLPCISDVEGTYPTEENQVMASKKALEFLGEGNAKIGDKIEIPCNINGEIVNKKFILSGYYTTYDIVEDTGYLLVSKEFVNANNLTLEGSGKLLVTLKSDVKKTAPNILDREIQLNNGQKFSYTYDRGENLTDTVVSTIAMIIIISLFIVFSGYLLIYNVLYIGVTKDINFYGLLKTIGTSPKQIKRIVKGQALRLSIVGIPLGLILGAIISFGIVPLAMGGLSTGINTTAMPGKISFNPIIFIGAGLFSLITVMISCKKPAKIAGNISPIEALRYSGDISKKQNKSRNTTRGGKLYKMAWYNVFREKKRAIIVFLSLFMGIITFLSVDTFLDSISIENYIDKYVKNDFVIQNVEGTGDKLDNDTINKIKSMEGVETVDLIKISELELEMNEDILLPALKYNYEKFNLSEGELESDLRKFNENPSLLKASIVSIDDEFIKKFNNELNYKIYIDAFKNGQIALVSSWYYGDDYKNINGDLIIKNPKTNKLKEFSIKILEQGSTLLPSGMETSLGIPTIYVSNSALENLDNNATNHLLYVDVNKKYEEQIETELKTIGTNNGLFIESKSDKTEEFNKSQMVMNILGSGISVVLILIGILNFINIMITGVNIRLKEFAIMESIGMTKKQIKKMLTFEGLYYALVTTAIVLTLGVVIIYGVSELTKNIIDYAVFIFPTTSLIILTTIIFIVCLITPSIVFKVLSKKSVVERIREIKY